MVDLTDEVGSKTSKKKSKVSCKEMPETTGRKKHDGDGKGNNTVMSYENFRH